MAEKAFPTTWRFGDFVLDRQERQLRRDGAVVELSARYFDALALLVDAAGRLVTKDRFLDEVWRGVPVTDEALTQCIRMLRRALGDEAARPRFIETVPKHGYRFVAPLDVAADRTAAVPAERGAMRRWLLLGGAGTIGAGIAGLIGGLAYGFVGAAMPGGAGSGVSSLLVVVWLTIAVALMGGAGVSLGIAAADRAPHRAWRIAGGAAGGLVVGGLVKLLGVDAFRLLLGRSPDAMTGAFEGLMLGGAVGIGAFLANGLSLRRSIAMAALTGGVIAATIPLLGGRLMAGSLQLLADSFPGSRLRLDRIGGWFGESGFGPAAQVTTAAAEGALFAGCIVGAMMLARRD